VTMAEPPALHQRGSVFLYFSNKNPSEIILTESHPTMKTSVNVFNSSKPLFKALAKKYPDEKEYVILVHDVITSVDGDEDITWHTEKINLFFMCLWYV